MGGQCFAYRHANWDLFMLDSDVSIKLKAFCGHLSLYNYKLKIKRDYLCYYCAFDNLSHLTLRTSVQNRYFQRHRGAKKECRHGRCSNLSAWPTHPTKSDAHRQIKSVPFMWKVFSEPDPQTALTTISRLPTLWREQVYGPEKTRLTGNV